MFNLIEALPQMIMNSIYSSSCSLNFSTRYELQSGIWFMSINPTPQHTSDEEQSNWTKNHALQWGRKEKSKIPLLCLLNSTPENCMEHYQNHMNEHCLMSSHLSFPWNIFRNSKLNIGSNHGRMREFWNWLYAKLDEHHISEGNKFIDFFHSNLYIDFQILAWIVANYL